MTVFSFYFPSDDHDQDGFMHSLWNDRTMDYLIYVQRISHRGNPYIKGLFIWKDESVPLPSEWEVYPIPDDVVKHVYRQFKEEQELENNGVELGHPPTQISP